MTFALWLLSQVPSLPAERGLPTSTDLDLFKIALGQSPMAATMLLAIWMFKREFQRMLSLNDQKSETQNKLIGDCMIAITRNTAFTESCQRALEANTNQTNAAAAAMNLLVNTLQARLPVDRGPDRMKP